MSQLAIRDYNGMQVRTIENNGNLWFVVQDIANVLDIKGTTTNLVRPLDDDTKGCQTLTTPGGVQSVLCVTEAGLYQILLRSHKPQAKPFRRWVTHEVLPSIRRTGSYTVPHQDDITEELENDQLFQTIRATLELRRAHLLTERRAAEAKAAAEKAQLTADRAQFTATAALNVHSCNYGHYSILAYCSNHGIPCSARDAAIAGKAVSRICRDQGIDVQSVPDPRFGRVNIYPEAVLDRYFSDRYRPAKPCKLDFESIMARERKNLELVRLGADPYLL